MRGVDGEAFSGIGWAVPVVILGGESKRVP
jgi:hypothetical protein